MHEAGYVLTDRNPDYVVLGETRTYSFEAITTAIRLMLGGCPVRVHQSGSRPGPAGPACCRRRVRWPR